jgi:hypothetical protein
MLLVTGDLHLNNNPRDRYRHNWVKTLPDLIRQYKVDGVALLGDLTDAKDYHPGILVNDVVAHVARVAQLVPTVIDEGNHDYASLTEVAFFTFLKSLPNTHWVNKPTFGEELPTKHMQALFKDCLLLPHTPNHERDWNNLDMKRLRFIFAHNTFAGASADSGRKLDGIPTKVFPMDAHVISGDIHTPQSFDQITYVGSPYTVDFGDDFAPRFLLLDGTKVTSVRCSGPQKRLLDIDADKKPLPKGFMRGWNEGDIVMVRVHLTQAQYPKFSEFRDGVYAWGERHKLIIHQVSAVVDRSITPIKQTTTHQARPDSEHVKDFAKSRSIDKDTLKIGLEIVS